MTAHAFVLSQYYVTYKRSKIRGLWHTFGCSTDDERCVHARARWVRVRTPKTRPGLDTRVPGCDVWAASSSGYESRRRTGGEVPENLVNESRREKRDKEKERDIHICIYISSREKREERQTKQRTKFVFPLIEREREKEREKRAPWMPPGETPVPRDAITKGVITTWGTHTTKRNVAAAIA